MAQFRVSQTLSLNVALAASVFLHCVVLSFLMLNLSISVESNTSSGIAYDFEIHESKSQKKMATPVLENPVKEEKEKVGQRLHQDTSQQSNESEVTDLESQFAGSRELASPVQKYLRILRRKIELQREYPIASMKLKEQGLVKVVISLNQKGDLLQAQLVQASPHDRLNEAALKAIRKAGPFGEFPKEVNRPKWNIAVPIRFSVQ